MRITTKGRYALRAMIYLSRNNGDKPLSIKRIAETEDLSPIFMEQIFTKLKKFGLIQSVRGAGGGFLLAKDASEINVKDILEAVEEGIRLTPCCSSESVSADDCIRSEECRALDFWNTANEHMMEFFAGYSLEKVIAEFEDVSVNIPASHII